jgi:predicted  nucleic acid-binding Zn-ribbon protein
MTRSPIRFTGRACLLACACGIGWGPLAVHAQEREIPLAPPRKSDAPANFDPADVYFQGWLLSRDAEKLQAEKRYAESLEKLQRARELFDSVATYFPMWKREMVGGRRAQTQETIDQVAPLALKEQDEEKRDLAQLEGGVMKGQSAKPLNGGIPAAPVQPSREIESLETSRIAELEKHVQELQGQLAKKPDPAPNASSRDADRARDMAKQRDIARAELKRANDELSQLRSKFAAAPMQEELQQLNGKINSLERDKAAMGEALGRSQDQTRTAKEQIAALQAERARLLQQTADLQRNLESERKVQNDVIAGQQKQLREYQEQLRAANDKLAGANQKIASLENQLGKVREDFQALRDERDNLMRERDQMSALLKLNEGSQIQTLIDQNMSLAKQLREAGEKLDRLNQDNNANQDALIEATRDLAIAKQNINDLKREKIAQDKRMSELEGRLHGEDQQLAAGGGDPAEVEMLRGIIQKQIKIQERRRKQADILLEIARDKAKDDEKVAQALDLYTDEEIPLSPEEMNLLQGRKVDGEFISPITRPKAEVDANVARLEQENMPYTDAARRAFLNQRFESCRELYELVLERNPGDTDTRCKMGVVQLRLQDPVMAADTFRRATELDTTNPYAHRMLGYSLMQTGELDEAMKALQESVKLAPTNADGRVVLGKLHFDVGQEAEAEEQFKSAITYDDAMPYPHLNLAYLYAKQGKKKQALEYYKNAMERGAAPDLGLDKLIGKADR